MRKTVLILTIVVLTISFIAFSGCVESTEQLLEENSTYEESPAEQFLEESSINGDNQVTFVGTGTVEDGPAKTLRTVDDNVSAKTSSITSGFSSKARVKNIAPVAIIDSITPGTATFGSEITFTGSGSDTDGTIVAYLWTSDGKQISTEASFSTSDIAAGTHTINFNVKDDDGAWSEEATETLTITEIPNVVPVARIGSINPGTATFGSEITFTGTGTDEDGSIVAYLWTSDGTELSTQASFSTSDIAAGTHAINFSVKDDDGAWSEEATETLTITEIPNVVPVARIGSINPGTATFGSEITFTGTGTDEDGSIVAYLWTSDGTELSTQASFSTSSVAVGTHTINFSVKDNDGAWSEEATETMTITEFPNVAPVAIIDSITPGTATFGSEITFTGSGSDTDGTTVAYLWTSDGKQISTEASFSTSDIAAGTHTIAFSVKDNDGAWSEEATAIMTITELPNVAPVASIDSITPGTATFGSEITFTGTGTDTDGTIVAYLWTSDGTELSTKASFSTSDIPVGTHTIAFSVKDNDGAWSNEVNRTLNITERPVEVPSGTSVILTFDDGWKTDYDVVYPLLKARNIRSTHYIIASAVGTGSYMSWDEIKAMYDDGFDMECHSNTHSDLTTISSKAVRQEMLKVNEAFVAQGMPAPRHTAYPYGEYNEEVISIVSEYRDTGRVVSWNNDTEYHTLYPVESLKTPYELPSYPADFHATMTQIDEAIAGNYTLILCIHAVSDIPGEYNMSRSEFVSILDYIESNDIPTQTISEYYKENFET